MSVPVTPIPIMSLILLFLPASKESREAQGFLYLFYIVAKTYMDKVRNRHIGHSTNSFGDFILKEGIKLFQHEQ